MSAVAEQLGTWLEAFTSQPPAEPWVQKLRDEAFAKLSALGFPTTHNEEWRFTNVNRIANVPWASLVTQASGLPSEVKPHLAQYASLDNPFVALNTAFLNDVKVIQIPRGAVIKEPIEVTYEAGQAGGLPHCPQNVPAVDA